MCILFLLNLIAVETIAVPPLILIDIGYKSSTSLATKIAAQVCVGLFNRNEIAAGPVYTLMSPRDVTWFEDIEGISPPEAMPTPDFVTKCLRTRSSIDQTPMAKGYIRYNVTSQQLLVPNIITLAAVLDAIPLEDGHPDIQNTTMVFDALKEFNGFSPYNATAYMHTHYVDKTTGMAMMNPGLDTHKDPFNPPLTGLPNPGLIDYIVKERLFNFFLNQGCIPLTEEHALMEKIVTNNPWSRPIGVMGYNDAFGMTGDIYEAETDCNREHNMGQIASSGTNNLAFFSRKPKITVPILQNADPPAYKYNESKTYMAFVIGDGDNVNFVMGSRKNWMEQRVGYCKKDPSYKNCFPLLWSMSPQTLHLAPDILMWYYNQSYLTKNDYFVLPPSGDLYAYPSMMNAANEISFVTKTEQDCFLMNTSATVAWEWTLTWTHAINQYFPRYAQNDIVRGFFAVNVPFNFPILDFEKDEYYKIFKKKTVLFKPREWRGTKNSSIPFSHKNYLTVEEMAAEINGYPKGTVSNIYLTSDGGANLDTLYMLVQQLDEHVQVVNHNTIVDFALQRG